MIKKFGPTEMAPLHMPAVGKLVLMDREMSSMASTWREYLCIERAGPGRYVLSTCVREVFGSVYDLIPEEDLYDEDGKMVVPDQFEGKNASLADGEYLIGDELIDDPSVEPVEFGRDTLTRALNFYNEGDWSKERHSLRVWRRIKNLVRLDDQSPLIGIKPMHADKQPLVDDLVDRAIGRGGRRRGFKRLGAWISDNDWDMLTDDVLPSGCWHDAAVDLKSHEAGLSDADLVDHSGRSNRRGLDDKLRVQYARARLREVFDRYDDHVVSVHAYPLQHSDSTLAYLCATVEMRGQADPEIQWHGAFMSLDAYQDWLLSCNLVHADDLPDLTDAQILAVWRK